MFYNSIKEIMLDIWPSLLICCVISISLRITFLVKNKVKFVFYKEILMLGFIMYVIALFEVVTFQDVSWSSSNFILFKEMLRYEFGTKLFFKNVIGNMIMFIPFGFFTSYFLKFKKFYAIFFLTFLTSITIILAVPTMISSLLGMNVGLPFQNSQYGFIIILAISILMTLIVTWWLNRKDML